MKTRTRTMSIALVAAVVALAVSAVAGAKAPNSPGSPAGPSGGGIRPGGAMCTIDHPDCNDSGLGGGSLGSVTGSSGSVGVTGPGGATGSMPVPSAGDPQPQIVEPTPGMAGVAARPFDTATVGSDDRTVTIDFVSGVEPCYVLDHIGVVYGDQTVTITLFEGHDPAAANTVCIEIGVYKRSVVMLDQPLAGRTIVDGATA